MRVIKINLRGIGMNTREQLLGMALFVLLINSASAQCILFEYGNSTYDVDTHDVLNSYDPSGLFKGFLVCIDNETFAIEGSDIGGRSGDSISQTQSDVGIDIEISESYADKCNLKPSNGQIRNVTRGTLEIQGRYADYILWEKADDEESISLETGEPVKWDYAEFDKDAGSYINKYNKERESARRVNLYHWYAELCYPIDSHAVLTWELRRMTNPEEAIDHFRSINVTVLHGENLRYLMNTAAQSYELGDYNKALEYYQKVDAFDKIDRLSPLINDNIGMCLYHLGRHSEALTWFDYHKPGYYDSVEAWNIYGQLLEAGNFTDEAEYAFSEAERQKRRIAIEEDNS
jgi:hypothetical protein